MQHPDVPHGRGLVGEPPVAEAAAVRLGPRVRHRVPLQHPASVELLGAVLAREHVREGRLPGEEGPNSMEQILTLVLA